MKTNPILYLHEYEYISEDILYWKNDEHLKPWKPASDLEAGFCNCGEPKPGHAEHVHLCVGIGTYKTVEDGEIYLCALLNSENRRVEAYSMGVHCSPELVGKALQIYFASHSNREDGEKMGKDNIFSVTLRSSQNPLYKKKIYGEIIRKFPVRMEMTEKGTRGGVMAVSTFFSQLMRKKGGYIFQTWQSAVDWLEEYIYFYNL